jgi:hypothetical protein
MGCGIFSAAAGAVMDAGLAEELVAPTTSDGRGATFSTAGFAAAGVGAYSQISSLNGQENIKHSNENASIREAGSRGSKHRGVLELGLRYDVGLCWLHLGGPYTR